MVRNVALLLLALSLGGIGPASARLLRLEVQEVVSPAFDGRTFGAVGTYDRIAARATIGVDPSDPRNAVLVDVAAAPRNALGLVEAVSNVVILRPTDPTRANGVLLYDVANRGNKAGLPLFNDAPPGNAVRRAADAGNGFLMQQGYSIVWSGWQHDVAPGPDVLRLVAPVVSGANGPLTGQSREEFVWDVTTTPMTVGLSYPAAERPDATLSVRAQETDARQTPPDLTFRFLDPKRIEITRPSEFDAGAIYEFIYTARDPVVGGLGFAAVRDLIAHLRRDADGNPLARNGAPEASHAYAVGISQGGRFLRDFLYQGFNDDEDGLQVFDAIVPVMAGARRSFTNARFSQPGRSPRQHEDHLYPGDGFPFSYNSTTDALTGKRDGLLASCELTQNCPKVMQVDTDQEAYQGRAALLVTDTRGFGLDLPETVRAYMLAGMPHSAVPGGVSEPQPACVMASNPLHPGSAMRALLVALDDWVRQALRPPGSRYPSRVHGTLVAPGPEAFPKLPGVAYAGQVNPVATVARNREPPEAGRAYPMFVPRTDPDGHAVDGIRLPEIEAPRASYTGWNLRREGFAPGALCSLAGGAVPLPATASAGDPRLPLDRRYPGPDDYWLAVQRAAERLVAERLLLRADADATVAAARAGTLAGFAK